MPPVRPASRSFVRLVLVLILANLPGVEPPSAARPREQAPPQEASLPSAAARMQANDPAGAAVMLEAVTAREPANGRAWRMLGVAYQRLKSYAKARAAYERALVIEPGSPMPMYNLACICALEGDKAQAFEWLGKAKGTTKLDITQITVDADLASLKDDPRFKALLPAAADFANPFVEPATILHEWDGEAANDQFGWIARSIGDVDGDRVNDIVTSAPTKEIGGAGAGRVYVYSGKSGALLWTADGHPGDRLGIGVEAAGDTNGDKVPDVIASAPGAGRAYIYSGRDGHVLITLAAEAQADAFGSHVSGVGDVDGDGRADVIVGAPANNAGGQGAGRAYVFSGKDGHELLRLTGERAGDAFGSAVAGGTVPGGFLLIVGAPKAGPRQGGRAYVYGDLAAKARFVIESDDTGAALGAMFLSVLGDVDGDGLPDVYASDFSNGAKGPATGRVYIHSGKNGNRLLTLTGETAGEGFGIGAATAGDVDRDGRADLIVGAWQYAGAAISGGRATLYSGRDGGVLRTYTCRIPGDTFGFDAVGLGDVNGDGVSDLLITSAWSGIKGYHSGRMFVISSGVAAGRRR